MGVAATGNTTEPIYRSGMRRFELATMYYELPQMLGGLLLGSAAGALFAHIINNYDLSPRMQQLTLAGLVAFGLFFIFLGASYYAREVKILPDRMVIEMAFSRREVKFEDLSAARPLSEVETRKTFFSLHFVNMTPAVRGAVALERKRGRVWVFSPEDPQALLSHLPASLGGGVKPSAEAEPAARVEE